MKKLTVITPCFNAESFIERCILSVKSQDYMDIEHIIIDGSSTDKTLEIISKHNVKYISEKDLGVYDAMSKGIELADDSVVHILNADDYYAEPTTASTVMSKFTRESLDICHGYINLVDSAGKVLRRKGEQVTYEELRAKMKVAHPAFFVDKSIYDRYGKYSQSFSLAADQDFLLRIWPNVKIGFIPDVLINMELGGLSVTHYILSYRQSLSISILHGRNPFIACMSFYKELLKHKLLSLFGKI